MPGSPRQNVQNEDRITKTWTIDMHMAPYLKHHKRSKIDKTTFQVSSVQYFPLSCYYVVARYVLLAVSLRRNPEALLKSPWKALWSLESIVYVILKVCNLEIVCNWGNIIRENLQREFFLMLFTKQLKLNQKAIHSWRLHTVTSWNNSKMAPLSKHGPNLLSYTFHLTCFERHNGCSCAGRGSCGFLYIFLQKLDTILKNNRKIRLKRPRGEIIEQISSWWCLARFFHFIRSSPVSKAHRRYNLASAVETSL